MKNKVLLILCFFLTGCVGKLESYNSLSEEEVINYSRNTIYEELGDDVEIEILWKHQEKLCDFYLDGCFSEHKVPNTYTYRLKITSKNNPEISTNDNYFTDSYKVDGNIVERALYYKSYKEAYAQKKGMSEIVSRLQEIKYDIIGNQILIFSTDYNYLHKELFSFLLNYDENFTYNIYVIKNEELFNTLLTTTFDYRGVAGIGTNIKNTYGYARDFLEIENIDSYKYIFFRYSSNGCTGCPSGCSCSALYGVN